MFTGHRRRTLVVTAVVVALVVGSVAAASSLDPDPERTLVVQNADSGETLLERPVENDEQVTLAYTHSVEKTPVEDVYVVDGDQLRMTEMRFQSHGAGLPADESMERTGDWFVVERNSTYSQLRVAPGSIAGHELVVGEDRYDLVAMSDGPVVIVVDEDEPGALEELLALSAPVEVTQDRLLGDEDRSSGSVATHTHMELTH
ncbi:DUF1850 domain-containing protein [Natronosalvus rutilus]|uniref:DUF1850 domain-containing protein n=1 Tax=Natronosalvus rutilus TaxID=2953753 RepID=A0A9E7SVV4_9EURY|nr:DUF1850 domain-containing protein [Natronosalvus rutilus]UTF54417.1 DUF1850 domain-containing protein [Natronosalvus rutilus]